MRNLVALLALGLTASAVDASGSARLEGLRLDIKGRIVEASVQLVDAFDADFLELIQTGLATGYTYDFKLLADRKHWFDNQIDSIKISVIATYDAVTREYTVNHLQDGKLLESRIVRDEQELEDVMTRLNSVGVFGFKGPSRRRQLFVRARAELGSRTILYIIPAKRTTGWVKSRKFRDPGAG